MVKKALKVNELCQTLKAKVSEEHYLLIQSVTEKSRENEFVKKKENLIRKFNELQTTSSKTNNQQPHMLQPHVKPNTIKHTDITLTDHQISLLNLGPKFVPTEKRIPFMEYQTKEAYARCHILNKNRNMKIKDNLTKDSPLNFLK